MRRSPRKPAWVVLPLVLLELGLLGGAGLAARDTLQLRDVAVRVPATVSAVRPHEDSDGDTTYAAVYAFTYDGRDRHHESSASSSSPPRVGSRATLLVDPSDPERVRPDTFMDQWFLSAVLGGVGLLIGVVGTAVVVIVARGSRSTTGSAPSPVTASTALPPAGRAAPTPPAPTEPDPRGPFL